MEPSLTPGSVWALWHAMRDKGPLVQCITNLVSMDLMANTLLAAGASPAMAHALDEVEDFVGIADALLINISNLSSDWNAAKKLAAQKAVALGKPWVLDPVGCGATPYRTQMCLALLQLRPTVVRGNASEILALAGAAGSAVRGVDSTAESHEALDAAKALARRCSCIVAVSGATDLVTDGTRVAGVSNGVPLLTRVTATGCSLTALIAAFLAVAPKGGELEATAAALAVFGLAGETSLAAAPRPGPGSLRVGLLDALHIMGEAEVLAGVRVRVMEG
ncbi:hydroxyethylthiazole kinase [Monoraphidium neglectum]|uniref:hydroxyethylthiazole kinase n=1 Tax=Monoraphidium neglectum TaxID=145388 RepID=A0A0D2LVB1_9CHLO|nr:hydroxyethylthiazole kinase [Monoraphidium neglectum]KIY95519.1 hydroxyethylthiazole kinase [Monoraphidium neglectum]|eukprot:XP_013894539.1 hydroxyethylthiazole kinase [Monoraphidium neglectum]